MKNLHYTALGMALLCLPPGISARQGAQDVEEVIVTSSRIETPLRQIGTSVSVVTEAQIEDHGNLSLVDVLRQTPAVGSSGNGGAGKSTSLRIRGEEGFRTLTVFDGIRLSDPSLPQTGPQVEQILSAGVGRVEILRGPQGLGYGADAGGVVNILTRRTQAGMRADLDVESGDFGTRRVSGTASGHSDQLDYFFTATDFTTAGFNSRTTDQVLRDDDGYDNQTLHGRLGYRLSDNWRVDLVHRNVAGESEFDGCFSQVTVHDCEADYRLGATRLSVEFDNDSLTHQLSYAVTDTKRRSYALGALAFGNDGRLERWEYQGNLRDLPGFDLVFGVDLEEADSGSTSRNNTGVYLEYLSDFSDSLFITAGLRHDDNDHFGTNTSSRLSLAYLIDTRSAALWKIRAAYGTGFRAPSPFEIEYNRGPFAFPPASSVNLRQEQSRGYELGLEYRRDTRPNAAGQFRAEVVAFDQRIEDAIYFDLSGFSGYLQETGSSSSTGIEVSAGWSLSSALELSANYTHNETETSDGQQRIRRPEQLGNLGLIYGTSEDRLRLGAFYRVSRDAVDEVFGSRVPLEDFQVLDLSVTYQWHDNLSLFGRVENSTDEDYQEVTGFNTAGRAFYVGMRFAF